MLKKVVLLFCALMLVAGAAFAETKTIVFATDSTWPPMEFVNADQQIVGFAIVYMTKAGELAGFKAEFKAVA